MHKIEKMYVVVRQDLSGGYQIAQAVHAKDMFSHEHPKLENKWYNTSNTIAVLGVDDEKHLLSIVEIADRENLKFSLFYEPDIQEYTAVAIEPGVYTSELLSELKLAGHRKGKNKRRK